MQIRILLLIGVSLMTTRGYAQMPLNESYLKAIKAEDAKVQRLEMKWRLTSIHYATPQLNVEKSAAMLDAGLKQAGWTDEARKEHIAKHRLTVGKERNYVIDFTYLRDDGRVRAEILYETLLDNRQAHYFQAYDGINAITVSGAGQETPKWGSLTRERKDILNQIGVYPLAQLFLFHGPIFEALSEKETRMIAEDAESVTLDCPTLTPILMHLRVRISKECWRPTAADLINPVNGKSSFRLTATGYHQCQGVWIPSSVEQKMTTESGKIISVNEHTLQSAQMNEKATNAHLDPIVPRGTNMGDFRFGPDKGISYRVTSFIPSDERVRFMLAKDREAQTAMERDMKRRALLTGTSAALASCLGIFAWRRRRGISRARKSDSDTFDA